jgi:DNA-binding response OmpR family regulator
LTIDASERTATLDGRPLELARKEFDLLHHLAAHKGKVVTKRELLSAVWHQPLGGGDKTVDVHLSWLRRKLGETADEPRYLRTVRGVGIRLVDPTATTTNGDR